MGGIGEKMIKSCFGFALLSLIPFGVYAKGSRNNAITDAHVDLVGDFVYMRRQHSMEKSLILDPDKKRFCGDCSNYAILTTKDLINDQGFEPGFRGAVIYRYDPKWSFEGQVLWVSPWEEEQEKKGNHDLYFGINEENYNGDYVDADKASGNYRTDFWTAEINGWRHWTPRNTNYFSLSGVLGMRYFHFNEGLGITYWKNLDKSHYRIHTKSDAFGVQVGLNLQVNPTRLLTWEFVGKFGLMMDYEQVWQDFKDDDNSVTIRDFKRMRWQNGCFADVLALLGMQFKQHLQLRGGYQFIYLSSVATAEEQVSKKLTPGSGKHVRTDGVAMIHGLLVGLVISW